MDDSGKEGGARPIPRNVHDVTDLTSPVQNPAPKKPSQNHADVSVICLSDDDDETTENEKLRKQIFNVNKVSSELKLVCRYSSRPVPTQIYLGEGFYVHYSIVLILIFSV